MPESMQDIMNPGAMQDNKDFPNAPADWSMLDTQQLAQHESLSLTPDHWHTVRALQEYFARNKDKKPNVREIHDALDERFHAQGGIKYLYSLFPGGPVAQGCRLAGIQPPAGATDKSFGSVQ